MKLLVNTKDLPRKEWLNFRRLGIGGSDVGVIAGVNKYKSPFTLYLEKLGEIQDGEQSESAYWGNTLENVVAQEFTIRTGLKVQERHELLQHNEYPFMLANLDREIICPERGIGVLECKTAGEYMKEEWTADKIPDSYYLQVQHYLAVTGYSFAYIAVLIGGNKFVIKEIERDEEVISMLIQMESDFWNNHVLPKIPPAIDNHDSTTQSLHEMYAETNGNSIEISLNCLEWLECLKDIKAKIKRLEDSKKLYENHIKNELAENEIGIYNGEELVTWKANKRGIRSLKIKEVS